jgi:hypothetical protein
LDNDDGLTDGQETDGVTVRVYGASETYVTDLTDPDTDGDGLTDDTETEGWTVPTINRSGQAYRYATHEANGSVHVDSNPRKKDSDGDVITDRAEKFRAHTDPSGDVRYAIANTLATGPVQLEQTRDSDQDGFPDRQEFQGIPTHVDGEFTQFETDPLNPDTDGDRLHESTEFASLTTVGRDVGATNVQTDIFPLISDPTETDSDGDRLTDRTELQLGTDPLSADTDGDKIVDFRDENPTTDDSPPAVTFNRERLDRIGGYFRISDGSEIAEIDIEAHYPGSGWQPRPRAVGTIEADERYSFGVGTYDGKQADRYWVNVTDTNGNTAGYLFEFEANGEDLARTAVVTGTGFAASPDPYLGDNVVGATVAAGGIIVLTASIELGSEVRTEQVTSFLAAEPVNQWEDTVAGHVALPPGFVETANGQTRGRGWAYIQATSGVTQDQIGDILENGERVPREGLRDYVIGQAGERAVILTIIGGTLMAADSLERPVEHDSSESNCNGDDFTVETDNDRGEEGNPEHTIRDGKPINDIGKIDQIIKNPDRILDFSNNRYIIKEFADGVAVIVTGQNLRYDAVYELITQLTDDGSLFDTVQEAVERIKDRQDSEPDKDINC